MVKQLETGLREIDLVSLRKLQIIEISQGDLLESEDVEWRIHAEEEVSSDGKCREGAQCGYAFGAQYNHQMSF